MEPDCFGHDTGVISRPQRSSLILRITTTTTITQSSEICVKLGKRIHDRLVKGSGDGMLRCYGWRRLSYAVAMGIIS